MIQMITMHLKLPRLKWLFKPFLAAALMIFALTINSFAQSNGDMAFSWANVLGTDGNYSSTDAIAAATDPAGNVFVTGPFTGDLKIGDSTIHSFMGDWGPVQDIYLAKYDRSGKPLWVKRFGGAGGSDNVNDITVDKEGNVYFTGTFSKDSYFGKDTITSMPTPTYYASSDIYICKLDNDGNVIWVKGVGGAGTDYGKYISVDDDLNVYYAGTLQSDQPVDFNLSKNPEDTFFLAGLNSSADIFISKIDSAGNFIWATRLGGEGSEYIYGMAADKQGNALVSGSFSMVGDFGGIILATGASSNYSSNGFLAKLDGTGKVQWAKKLGTSTASSSNQGVTTDEAGNIYTVGYVGYDNTGKTFPIDLGGYPVTGIHKGNDIVITKLKADGTGVWTKVLGGDQSDQAASIAVDKAGNVYSTGYFGSGNFFPTEEDTSVKLTGSGYNNAYLNKMDNDGNYIWAKALSCAGSAKGNSICTDGSGNLLLVGNFQGDIDLDPGTGVADTANFSLIPQGYQDAFVLSLSCDDTVLVKIKDTACRSLVYNNTEYDSTGVYYQVFTSTSGCDSTVELHLKVYDIAAIINADSNAKLTTTEVFDTYQWLLDGTAIEGATKKSYKALRNGDYQVVVSNKFGCTDTSDVFKVNTLAITETHLGRDIRVFPNPSDALIHIKSPVPVNIQLISIEGKDIRNATNAKVLSVQDLAEGIYFLRIFDTKGALIKVEKIIRQNK